MFDSNFTDDCSYGVSLKKICTSLGNNGFVPNGTSHYLIQQRYRLLTHIYVARICPTIRNIPVALWLFIMVLKGNFPLSTQFLSIHPLCTQVKFYHEWITQSPEVPWYASRLYIHHIMENGVDEDYWIWILTLCMLNSFEHTKKYLYFFFNFVTLESHTQLE